MTGMRDTTTKAVSCVKALAWLRDTAESGILVVRSDMTRRKKSTMETEQLRIVR
jgi:hypothetical protein